jgi:hypothetical protein
MGQGLLTEAPKRTYATFNPAWVAVMRLNISETEEYGTGMLLRKNWDVTQEEPTTIWEDKNACIAMANNPELQDRLKHVDVKCVYSVC